MVSFSRPKPQPEHTPEELALVQHISPGTTSNTELQLWRSHRLYDTPLDEVLGSLNLEQNTDLSCT